MSEDLRDKLHNLVTQVSSIRLKTELALDRHPEVAELQDVIEITEEIQLALAASMKMVEQLPPR